MAEFSGRVGHLDGIESPWANAGGVVRTVEEVEAMARTGVGMIEDGSQTIPSRLGNAIDPDHPELGPIRKVYTHNPQTGETGNSLDMPGRGMDVAEIEIPEKVHIAEAYNKKFVENVAPVSDDPVAESKELVHRAYSAGAHAVLLNAGCPNVVSPDGGRHELLSRNPRVFKQVLNGLKPVVEQFMPIFVRISPQETYRDMFAIARAIRTSKVVSAVFTPNTWPGFVPLDEKGKPILEVPGGAGGRSGPAVADEAYVQTFWLSVALSGSNIDIVRSAGITNARELQRSLDINPRVKGGAGTTFFYESQNGWQDDVDQLLKELAA